MVVQSLVDMTKRFLKETQATTRGTPNSDTSVLEGRGLGWGLQMNKLYNYIRGCQWKRN